MINNVSPAGSTNAMSSPNGAAPVPAGRFDELMARQIGTSKTSATPTTMVDDGPGGSGTTLQLDARGHIVCNCPECAARANAASQPARPAANPVAAIGVTASPSANTTLPALRVSATWAMDLLSKPWNSASGTTKA